MKNIILREPLGSDRTVCISLANRHSESTTLELNHCADFEICFSHYFTPLRVNELIVISAKRRETRSSNHTTFTVCGDVICITVINTGLDFSLTTSPTSSALDCSFAISLAPLLSTPSQL